MRTTFNWSQIKSRLIFWQNPAISTEELILDRRRVYIIPSKVGFSYVILLIMIFTAAINFNLNLGYALTFLLATVAIIDMLQTFRNLAGLGLLASPPQPVHFGEVAQWTVHLANRDAQARHAIAIGFSTHLMQMTDVDAASNGSFTLSHTPLRRGWHRCPRIRLQTSFPMGLFSAWAYWQTSQHVLVYPQPEPLAPELPYASVDGGKALSRAGQDEFTGVRNYQPGDPPKNLAWRQMARQSGGANDVLLSKHFSGGQEETCILDYSMLPHTMTTEQKLSRLCAWILTAEQQGHRYELKLGAQRFASAAGEQHQRACLAALALFSSAEPT